MNFFDYQAKKAKLPTYAQRVKAYRSEWAANRSLASFRAMVNSALSKSTKV